MRPSDGCTDVETPVVGAHPVDACRPPSALCGVGAGPTSWAAYLMDTPLPLNDLVLRAANRRKWAWDGRSLSSLQERLQRGVTSYGTTCRKWFMQTDRCFWRSYSASRRRIVLKWLKFGKTAQCHLEDWCHLETGNSCLVSLGRLAECHLKESCRIARKVATSHGSLKCDPRFLSADRVTTWTRDDALWHQAETFSHASDTRTYCSSGTAFTCLFFLILRSSSSSFHCRSHPGRRIQRFLYLLHVLMSLRVLPCSFLPPSSYAIVGYDTVKDAELAADEHSSAVLDNYQLAVFSYPSLQQSNAGTAFEYHRNTEMFPNLGIDCSQWTHNYVCIESEINDDYYY